MGVPAALHSAPNMSTQAPAFVASEIPRTVRIAIAASRFNQEIVDELLAGCERRLRELGITAARVEIHRVPGAFELPLAAKALARTRRFGAIILSRRCRARRDASL